LAITSELGGVLEPRPGWRSARLSSSRPRPPRRPAPRVAPPAPRNDGAPSTASAPRGSATASRRPASRDRAARAPSYTTNADRSPASPASGQVTHAALQAPASAERRSWVCWLSCADARACRQRDAATRDRRARSRGDDAEVRRRLRDRPWEVYEFNAGNADFREYGQPVERSWRLAVATVGQVQWELIEPLDEESVYARSSPRRARVSNTSQSPLRTSTRPLRRPTAATA
jgi:hypothetical protein